MNTTAEVLFREIHNLEILSVKKKAKLSEVKCLT